MQQARRQIFDVNVTLRYEPPAENIYVKADRGKVARVIFNLLDNAIRFTEAGGDIFITAKKDGNQAIITVKDTGTGIDAEIFPKLFTRFVSKPYTGVGLGLFISKGIVEAHGGQIWAENNKDGQGATFYFTLPLADG